jgi:hypothetical protein
MNILPMTPQQLADARKEVNVEDVTVVLKFFGDEGEDEVLEGVWSVFAYAPRLDEPTELVALFDDNFESFEEARTIAYALSDNFECEVVVIDAEGDDNVLAPGERPTWMEDRMP